MKFFRLALALATVILLAAVASVSAVERNIIYENDFSSQHALDGLDLHGDWRVCDGVLRTDAGSGSAVLMYTLPGNCVGKDFRVEVDFLGHTSTGGILIGGDGQSLSASPAVFFGYDCFIGSNGKKAALGCYAANGAWSGNINVGFDTIDTGDLHLSVTVRGDNLTYLVTSLDGETRYYGVSYTVGTSARDVYSTFGGKVGLRKFYSDDGCFDNFRVTLIEEESLPPLDRTLALGDMTFAASAGVTASGDRLFGTGTALTNEALSDDFDLTCTAEITGASRFYFGMNGDDGYCFKVDKDAQTVSLWQIKNGEFSCLGEKSCAVGDGMRGVRICAKNKVASLFFEENRLDSEPFAKFEMTLSDYAAGNFGVKLEGGSIGKIKVVEPVAYAWETYTNPVAVGADPDVLYYEGTYYLYNRISMGNAVFRVSTSPDLVHWTARNTVFYHESGNVTSGYMSPNVFYYDGVFYLFYAAKNAAGQERVWYATSDSPYGPFTHKEGQKPLHDASEIGGHPYLDESGRIYMSFVRFGGGNHIWLEEVTMCDGVVTPVEGTLTCVISPSEAYENDGYGSISEGGVLYKHNGFYYMIYASGHYKGHYGESYAVAESILGPYTKYEYNEILTYNAFADGVGDGIFVPSPDGKELYMVYHRHASVGRVEPRRTCIDLVKFVPSEGGGPDILTVCGPSTTARPMPSDIGRGDFDGDGRLTLRDALMLCYDNQSRTEYSGAADINADGKNDASDIIALLEILIQK